MVSTLTAPNYFTWWTVCMHACCTCRAHRTRRTMCAHGKLQARTACSTHPARTALAAQALAHAMHTVHHPPPTAQTLHSLCAADTANAMRACAMPAQHSTHRLPTSTDPKRRHAHTRTWKVETLLLDEDCADNSKELTPFVPRMHGHYSQLHAD